MSELKPLLEEANRSSPSFAQLSLDMCKIIVSNDKQLPKSSKGTIQRGSAYEVFASEINALYAGESDSKSRRSLAGVQEELRKMILDIAGEKKRSLPLSLDTDLFNWGVDSLMATRVRAGIMRVSSPSSLTGNSGSCADLPCGRSATTSERGLRETFVKQTGTARLRPPGGALDRRTRRCPSNDEGLHPPTCCRTHRRLGVRVCEQAGMSFKDYCRL